MSDVPVTRTIAETRAALERLPRPVVLVPTMGALHEGHLALVREARGFAGRSGAVVMSLFVNPTQFGAGEDYHRYPRDEGRDLALAAREGVDLVFAPGVEKMYPHGSTTTVHVAGPLTESFEGATRPGHFDGVATVVTKLFAIVRPDAAFFGRKDAQQLALVRRLVADLHLGVRIIGVHTVRAADGLALSSRNANLDARGRAAAARLYASLRAGRAAATRSAATPGDVVAAVLAALDEGVDDGDKAARLAPDYVALVDPDTFVPETSVNPRSLLIAAVRLGATRLIDNISLRDGRSLRDEEDLVGDREAEKAAASLVERGGRPRSGARHRSTETKAPAPEERAAQEG